MLGLLCAPACVYEENEDLVDIDGVFSTTCPRAEGRNCDVRADGCRAAKWAYMACLRGVSVEQMDRPVVLFRSDVFDTFEMSAPERARTDLLGRGYALFGLQRPGIALSEVESDQLDDRLGGWYDSELDQITLILPAGASSTDDAANGLLAHEFVHALQDLEGKLDARLQARGTNDLRLARRALIEGEATFFAWMISAVQRDVSIWNLGVPDRDILDDMILGSPSSIALATLLFPYVTGADRVASLWRSDPVDGVERIAEFQPSRSAEVYVGLPVLESAQAADPPMRAPAALESARAAVFTSLGGVGLDVAGLVVLDASEARRDAAVAASGDDRFAVYDEASPVAVWMLTETRQGKLVAIGEALASRLDGVVTRTAMNAREQTVVILVASSDATLREAYLDRALRAAVGEEEGAFEGPFVDTGVDFDNLTAPMTRHTCRSLSSRTLEKSVHGPFQPRSAGPSWPGQAAFSAACSGCAG
jgi:hypothetical protein